MPDGPFKGMAPDPDSWTHPAKRRRAYAEGTIPEGEIVKRVACDVCGGAYREGDWPWCKGDYRQHWRDFSSVTAEAWSESVAARPNTTLVKD